MTTLDFEVESGGCEACPADCRECSHRQQDCECYTHAQEDGE